MKREGREHHYRFFNFLSPSRREWRFSDRELRKTPTWERERQNLSYKNQESHKIKE